MSVVAPSAAAPPKASADILRTPVPCSLVAHVIPVPMIAAVVTACATGPCRSVCRVVSGWSQGNTPPPATAANARAGSAIVSTPNAYPSLILMSFIPIPLFLDCGGQKAFVVIETVDPKHLRDASTFRPTFDENQKIDRLC